MQTAANAVHSLYLDIEQTSNINNERMLDPDIYKNQMNYLMNTFKSLLQSRFKKYTTTDKLVNGVHIVITFAPTEFSIGECYEKLPEITEIIYEASGSLRTKPSITTAAPNTDAFEYAAIARHPIVVYCIGGNKHNDKVHLHMWIYGIHNMELDTFKWIDAIDRSLRSLKVICSTGVPIFYEPAKDGVDQLYRQNWNYSALVNYITKRSHPSLMNYFDQKNNKNFLYAYA